MEFFLKEDSYNKKIYKLINELPLRVQSIIEHFPDMIAELVYQDIMRGAPDGIEGYPKKLKVRKIRVKGVDSVIGITIPGYAYYQRLSTSDIQDTVLYVKPREYTGKPLDKGAIILSKRNPWTMDTLPYEPDKLAATMQSRKVSTREVRKIQQKRKADLSQVRAELKEAEINISRVHPMLIQRRVFRDIAFEVLRKEFGINTKHIAHWRPALRNARRRHVAAVMRKLVRWFTVPSERKWKTEVVTQEEKASTVKKIQRFQDYVAGGGR